MKKGFKGYNARQEIKSKAIQMANDHLQTGDLYILSSAKDNPLLNDSVNFDMCNIYSVFPRIKCLLKIYIPEKIKSKCGYCKIT